MNILSSDHLDFIKTNIKEAVLTSSRNYNDNVPQHLTNSEFNLLQHLSINCNLVIQKADKGNSVIIDQKDVDVRYMEKILNDIHKFGKVRVKKGILNFSINNET